MAVSAATLGAIEREVERYAEAVRASNLTRKSKHTYTQNMARFVRWLRGEYTPGSSVQDTGDESPSQDAMLVTEHVFTRDVDFPETLP